MKTLHVVFELNPSKFMLRPWPKRLDKEGDTTKYFLLFGLGPLHLMYTKAPVTTYSSYRIDLSVIHTQ